MSSTQPEITNRAIGAGLLSLERPPGLTRRSPASWPHPAGSGDRVAPSGKASSNRGPTRARRCRGEVCVADLANTSQLKTVEDRLEDGHKPIDLLVNNAGGHFGPLETLAEGDRDVQTREALVNALAVLRLTHAAVNAMAKRRSGNVISVSAGVAFYPVPGSATYAASKAFVNSLTEAVNHELRGGGVAVTATCPGFTRTGAPKRLGFKEGEIPRSFWMDPEEVVKSALAAASRSRSLSSPVLINRLGALFGYYLPRPIVLRFADRYGFPRTTGIG